MGNQKYHNYNNFSAWHIRGSALFALCCCWCPMMRYYNVPYFCLLSVPLCSESGQRANRIKRQQRMLAIKMSCRRKKKLLPTTEQKTKKRRKIDFYFGDTNRLCVSICMRRIGVALACFYTPPSDICASATVFILSIVPRYALDGCVASGLGFVFGDWYLEYAPKSMTGIPWRQVMQCDCLLSLIQTTSKPTPHMLGW